MKTYAVIGIGIMGHGIADNLLKAGHRVVVWNRTAEKTDDLITGGAERAATVKAAVQQADIVIEVTANDESSREQWLGADGIVENATSDQQLITCATLSVDWTDELSKTCTDKGLRFFDMPMTGGRIAAESGWLTLLAGGDKASVDRLKTDLADIANEIKYFGKAGNGMRYKLVLNSLQAAHIAAFGEAMQRATAAGLDPSDVGPALVERPGGVMTEIAWTGYTKVQIPLTFSVEWIAKDLGYAQNMVEGSFPIFKDVEQKYDQAKRDGNGAKDWVIIAQPREMK